MLKGVKEKVGKGTGKTRSRFVIDGRLVKRSAVMQWPDATSANT